MLHVDPLLDGPNGIMDWHLFRAVMKTLEKFRDKPWAEKPTEVTSIANRVS
jgi:hypothetical protein